MQYIVFSGCIALSKFRFVIVPSAFITLLLTLPYLQLNSFVPILYSLLLCQCTKNIISAYHHEYLLILQKYTLPVIIHRVVYTFKGYDLRNFQGLMPYCSFKNSSGKQVKNENQCARKTALQIDMKLRRI